MNTYMHDLEKVLDILQSTSLKLPEAEKLEKVIKERLKPIISKEGLPPKFKIGEIVCYCFFDSSQEITNEFCFNFEFITINKIDVSDKGNIRYFEKEYYHYLEKSLIPLCDIESVFEKSYAHFKKQIQNKIKELKKKQFNPSLYFSRRQIWRDILKISPVSLRKMIKAGFFPRPDVIIKNKMFWEKEKTQPFINVILNQNHWKNIES